MNEAQVISINPAVKTIGEMGGQVTKLARISRRLTAPGRTIVSPFRKTVDFIFGINSKMSQLFSSKMLLLRAVCGALILASVLVPMTPEAVMAFEFDMPTMVLCGLGVLLVFGLFNRLACIGAAGWFGYSLVNSLIASQPDITDGSLFLLMVVFIVLGPGIFSLDQLMRLAILSARKKVLRARKAKRAKRNAQDPSMVSYTAFRDAHKLV